MSNFTGIKQAKNASKELKKPEYATVVAVDETKGVKIRIDGQENVLDIYYNSLQLVNVGDRVKILETSGSILILGKLQYGGADNG